MVISKGVCIIRISVYIFGLAFTILTLLGHCDSPNFADLLAKPRLIFFDPLKINTYGWRMFAGGASHILISRILVRTSDPQQITIYNIQKFKMNLLPKGTDIFYNSITISEDKWPKVMMSCKACLLNRNSVSAAFQLAKIPWNSTLGTHINDRITFDTVISIDCPCPKY